MYLVLILPLVSITIAQVLKFAIKSNKQKISLKNLLAYSGMPSGHSAMVVSLATIVGLKYGIDSPIFAVTIILAVVVIKDALGIRQYLGEHGKTLNVLVKDLKEDEVLDERYPHLLERIGHTPNQVLVGAAIGFLISVMGYLMF